MRPTTTQPHWGGPDDGMWHSRIQFESLIFEGRGTTEEAAVKNLQDGLREQIRRGNAAQRLLYFMTDAPSGTSNDGA